MDKQSLSYSKTFQGMFGTYKSLEYLDKIVEEQKVSEKEKKILRSVFTSVNWIMARADKIENRHFKLAVLNLFRLKTLAQFDKTNFSSPVIKSISRNFIVTKFKQGRSHPQAFHTNQRVKIDENENLPIEIKTRIKQEVKISNQNRHADNVGIKFKDGYETIINPKFLKVIKKENHATKTTD